jgi:hypothetical protein
LARAVISRRIALTVLLVVGVARLGAWELPAGWETRPPDAAQLATVLDAAEHEGWATVAPTLRDGALRAYEKDKTDAAGAWLGLARWAELLAEPERQFVPRWIDAINAAKVGHSNMARSYHPPATPLSAHVSPALTRWLLADRKFTDKFFGLLSPCDYLPAVLNALDKIFTADPQRFQTYAQLALAIAVVYDVPPPPGWPHAQVSQAVLPRRLPEPVAAFAFFVRADQTGKTLHPLAKLDADTLKFVVDVAAPFSELEWAQKMITYPLPSLAKSYTVVSYRTDRMQNDQNMWLGDTYDLPHILGAGGICVDQAYFATEAGKARGVPTIFFRGEGNDGRHAWFGYLDDRQKWQLDAGRYEEGNFVTGLAHDPQTWGNLSDHELTFLSEGFRAYPTYALSRLHAGIAATYLELKRAAPALAAARKAVGAERRNVDAWETLLAAQAATGADVKAREGVLHEAASALQRYPELNAQFRQRLADSLRTRGETSAADLEEKQIARNNQRDRSDLSTAQAALILKRATDTKPLSEQMQVYAGLVRQYGHDAGTGFYDAVTKPFVSRLALAGHKTEARLALDEARKELAPEAGSQLAEEMTKLAATLK